MQLLAVLDDVPGVNLVHRHTERVESGRAQRVAVLLVALSVRHCDPRDLDGPDSQRHHLRAAAGPDGAEIDEREPDLFFAFEPSAPLARLVVLRGEVQDLPAFPGDLDERVHDLAHAIVVTCPQCFIHQQGQAVPLLLLEETQPDREQQLDALAGRELLEGLLGGVNRVVGAEHAIVGRRQKLEAPRGDPGKEPAGAGEDLRRRGLVHGGADPAEYQVADGALLLVGAGVAQVLASGREGASGVGDLVTGPCPVDVAPDARDGLEQIIAARGCLRVLIAPCLDLFDRQRQQVCVVGKPAGRLLHGAAGLLETLLQVDQAVELIEQLAQAGLVSVGQAAVGEERRSRGQGCLQLRIDAVLDRSGGPAATVDRRVQLLQSVNCPANAGTGIGSGDPERLYESARFVRQCGDPTSVRGDPRLLAGERVVRVPPSPQVGGKKREPRVVAREDDAERLLQRIALLGMILLPLGEPALPGVEFLVLPAMQTGGLQHGQLRCQLAEPRGDIVRGPRFRCRQLTLLVSPAECRALRALAIAVPSSQHEPRQHRKGHDRNEPQQRVNQPRRDRQDRAEERKPDDRPSSPPARRGRGAGSGLRHPVREIPEAVPDGVQFVPVRQRVSRWQCRAPRLDGSPFPCQLVRLPGKRLCLRDGDFSGQRVELLRRERPAESSQAFIARAAVP